MKTLFSRHVSSKLLPLIDGELSPREAQQVQAHLTTCTRCRVDYEKVRSAIAALDELQTAHAPDSIWAAIEAAHTPQTAPASVGSFRWAYGFAAAVAVILVAAVVWHFAGRTDARWEVRRIEGSPAIAARHIGDVASARAGEWIETDSASRAAVQVGNIGSVELSPNTRLRIVTARADEHRLALARGEIRASISAPPRLFFVDTPAGTAIDLGCEYVLNSDEEGNGLLRVTRGWVAFEWKGIESLVPAGASCPMRSRSVPGIPYFDDASDRLKQALADFLSGNVKGNPLDVVLSESRTRDTLTLWHLLSRVDPGGRERVYDRMAALAGVPAGVSREAVLRLDTETLARWREELAWKW